MTQEEQQKFVGNLTGKLGTAAAFFMMEYNEARDKDRHLDYGLDSKLEPILTAKLAPLFAVVEAGQALINHMESENGKLCAKDVKCAECNLLRPFVENMLAALAELQKVVKS